MPTVSNNSIGTGGVFRWNSLLIRGVKRTCLLTGLGLAVAAVLLSFRELEPSYQGRSLSEWLLYYHPPSRPSPALPTQEEAAYVIRQIGTNALPCLVRWLPYEIPTWRMRFNKFVSRLPQGLIWTFRDRSLIKAEAAREGFKILGSNAAPSIPALARIANDPRLNWKWSGQRAVYSLGDIGEEALPVLVKTLANPHAPNRYLIINQIQRMNDSGVNISLAIPTILQCLSDADTNVVTEAKRQIAELKRQPQLLVSSLTNSLQGSDSHEQLATLKTLADLGDVATLAVPTLISMLSSPNAEVRSAATNLLAAVAPAVMPPNPH